MVPDVLLRAVIEADLPALFEIQADPAACQMAAVKPRSCDAFWAHWKKVFVDETVTARTILVGGQVAGSIGSFQRDGQRQVGYWVGKEYWGRGVATAALSAFLRSDRTRPLHARVAMQNVASIRVLEKCGFVIRGHDRPAANDRYEEVDEVILVLAAE